MSAVTDVKAKLYCNDCKNCKMLVWDSSSGMEKLENRGYVIEDSDTNSHYLVRCMWLKENVLQPHKLTKCEGKQSLNFQ